MKSVMMTLILLMFCSYNTMHASIIPPEANVLIQHENINLSMTYLSQGELIENSEFDMAGLDLTLDVKYNIEVMRIVDGLGNVRFSVPVMSDSVRLDINIFEKGINHILLIGPDGHDLSHIELEIHRGDS